MDFFLIQNSKYHLSESKLIISTLHCRTFLLLFPNLVFTKGQSCQKEDQGELWHTGFTNGAETAFSFLFFLLRPYLTLHSPQPIKFLWKLVSNINKWTSARARPTWPLKRQLYKCRAGCVCHPNLGTQEILLACAQLVSRGRHGAAPALSCGVGTSITGSRPHCSLQFPLGAEQLVSPVVSVPKQSS